jgi:hypothetical protein
MIDFFEFFPYGGFGGLGASSRPFWPRPDSTSAAPVVQFAYRSIVPIRGRAIKLVCRGSAPLGGKVLGNPDEPFSDGNRTIEWEL